MAAIGNVRGRGRASMLTGAMVKALAGFGLRVIALGVAQANAGAIRIYERMGFVKRCEFVEGLARRK
jgi:ribosomal protein S18 acetylase RimI-like enzyme